MTMTETASLNGNGRQAVVRSEPLTYERHGQHSYFADLIGSNQSAVARERLQRHAQEMEVISEERNQRAWRDIRTGGFEYRVEPNRTDGYGGYFTIPLWMNELFATAVRPGRVLAGLIPHFDLPQGCSSINLPIIGTGTRTQHVNDTMGVPDVDITDTAGSSTVVTIAGQADVALQMLEQSPAGAMIDFVLLKDLLEDYDRDLEAQLLMGGGSALNELLGVVNADTVITYTDGSAHGSGDVDLLRPACRPARRQQVPPAGVLPHADGPVELADHLRGHRWSTLRSLDPVLHGLRRCHPRPGRRPHLLARLPRRRHPRQPRRGGQSGPRHLHAADRPGAPRGPAPDQRVPRGPVGLARRPDPVPQPSGGHHQSVSHRDLLPRGYRHGRAQSVLSESRLCMSTADLPTQYPGSDPTRRASDRCGGTTHPRTSGTTRRAANHPPAPYVSAPNPKEALCPPKHIRSPRSSTSSLSSARRVSMRGQPRSTSSKSGSRLRATLRR